MSLGGGPTVNQAFTVTAGAGVLVVILEDRQSSTLLAEPATITWNGNTLTQDTNSQATTSNYRSMAVYHLYNPPAGTGNITASYSAAGNTIVITAYTLGGVDTTHVPIIVQTNNAGTVNSLFGTATGVAAGSWAAIGSIWGNTTALTYGADSGTATVAASTALGGSSIIAGYIANLNAGSVTIGATNSAGAKGCFIAEIFAPGAPTPPIITKQPNSLNIFTNITAHFTVTAVGAPPLTYQWYTNNTSSPLSNGGNISGTTSNVLTIANASFANVANHTVVVTGSLGSITSSVANLSIVLPSSAYERSVLTNGPMSFYTFSETSDPSAGNVVASDSMGVFSGIYGAGSFNVFNGIVGPQKTADGLIGFPDGNTALGTTPTLPIRQFLCRHLILIMALVRMCLRLLHGFTLQELQLTELR